MWSNGTTRGTDKVGSSWIYREIYFHLHRDAWVGVFTIHRRIRRFNSSSDINWGNLRKQFYVFVFPASPSQNRKIKKSFSRTNTIKYVWLLHENFSMIKTLYSAGNWIKTYRISMKRSRRVQSMHSCSQTWRFYSTRKTWWDKLKKKFSTERGCCTDERSQTTKAENINELRSSFSRFSFLFLDRLYLHNCLHEHSSSRWIKFSISISARNFVLTTKGMQDTLHTNTAVFAICIL